MQDDGEREFRVQQGTGARVSATSIPGYANLLISLSAGLEIAAAGADNRALAAVRLPRRSTLCPAKRTL